MFAWHWSLNTEIKIEKTKEKNLIRFRMHTMHTCWFACWMSTRFFPFDAHTHTSATSECWCTFCLDWSRLDGVRISRSSFVLKPLHFLRFERSCTKYSSVCVRFCSFFLALHVADVSDERKWKSSLSSLSVSDVCECVSFHTECVARCNWNPNDLYQLLQLAARNAKR